jgi:hypothetical protein
MVGYIFRAENTVTHKKYLGKYLSVRFDKKYLGDNPNVLADAEKYGADKFIVNMLKACESVKDCDAMYEIFLKEYDAKNNEEYYNFEGKTKEETVEEPVKPKRTRKKKVVEE